MIQWFDVVGTASYTFLHGVHRFSSALDCELTPLRAGWHFRWTLMRGLR